MISNFKVILFDLYGTLLVFNDFDRANYEWERAFFDTTAQKFNLDFQTIQTICKSILECRVKKDLSGGLTSYETKIQNEFAKYSVNFSVKEIKQLADISLEKWQSHIRLADDAFAVLQKLSDKYKIGLITNFDHGRHPRKVLASTGLEKYFNHVWISDEEECQKPDSEIFLKAAEYFNAKPEEIIYVGDNILDDVKGSYAAGMVPVLIDRKQKSNMNHNCDMETLHSQIKDVFVINSLTELLYL